MEYYNARRDVLNQQDQDNPTTPPRRKKTLRPLVLNDFEVVVHEQGYGQIRQKSSGETMHSVIEPRIEAELLYLNQSRFAELVQQPMPESPLVVWDVGLGAATNAMSVVHRYEALCKEGLTLRPVKIVSFENDLDSLKLALYHPGYFPHLCHQAPHQLLKHEGWRSTKGDLTWTLIFGDFLERMVQAPLPNIIFYDPFSFKADAPLWTFDAFSRLFERCGQRGVQLFTYSASTLVRAVMLASGFYVAKGVGSGPKGETTIAITPPALPVATDRTLLDSAWLARWERSGAQCPPQMNEVLRARFCELIRGHPQFRISKLAPGI